MRKYLLLSTVSLCVSGCLTSDVSPPVYYVINPASMSEEQKQSAPISIVIERPTVVSGLNTDRVALMTQNGRRLDYFAQARWNGQLDKIVQDFLIESFENNYDIVEVDTASLHQRADYMLVTKIRDFQAEYNDETDSSPTIKVTLVASILKLPEKTVVNRVIKTQAMAAQDNTMTEIIDGFESLLRQIARQLLEEMPKSRQP